MIVTLFNEFAYFSWIWCPFILCNINASKWFVFVPHFPPNFNSHMFLYRNGPQPLLVFVSCLGWLSLSFIYWPDEVISTKMLMMYTMCCWTYNSIYFCGHWHHEYSSTMLLMSSLSFDERIFSWLILMLVHIHYFKNNNISSCRISLLFFHTVNIREKLFVTVRGVSLSFF